MVSVPCAGPQVLHDRRRAVAGQAADRQRLPADLQHPVVAQRHDPTSQRALLIAVTVPPAMYVPPA